MAVTIHLPALLARHAAGARAITVEGSTVAEALLAAGRAHPELARRLEEATKPEAPFVAIYLNDEDVRFLRGFDTAVRDGDEVSVVSAIAGG